MTLSVSSATDPDLLAALTALESAGKCSVAICFLGASFIFSSLILIGVTSEMRK